MNRSPFIATTLWLVKDTFRQSKAQGIFYVLIALSALSIAVCLTIGVSGSPTLAQGDEQPDFVSRRDADAQDAAKLKMSGVTVAKGDLTLAFGAIDIPLARDTREAVHFVELVLAGGVADTLGLLLTLIWTAGFLPSFLEGRNIAVLLAKPAPRWMLLVGKTIGVLAFVLFQSLLFVGGTWAALGLRTGFWDPTYLLCVPLLLLHFSIFFAFSVLLAVCTRSPIVCVLGSLTFWGVAWSMNVGRHALTLATNMAAGTVHESMSHTVDLGYWILPKPADLGLLLYDALGAGSHFGALFDLAALQAHGFSMLLSIASSLAFAACVYYAAVRSFKVASY